MVAKKQTGKINAESFDDVPVLKRKWRAALRAGERLPRYEDVMPGSLGRLADHMNGAVTSPGGSGSATTSQRKACDRPSRRTGARRWCRHDRIARSDRNRCGDRFDRRWWGLPAYDTGNSFRVV